jgi:alpha-mannosidase
MPDIRTIYLVHHSHTDIGYTTDQPVVWDLFTRFIDQALELAERYADCDSDGAFRWTIETTATLQAWLEHASSRDVERLQALERAGRIEIAGMFAHLTPLVDTDQLIESFQLLRTLRRDYGFTIRHAMNCDVNGVNWPFADVLLDCGIEGFTMAINSHFGGPLKPRPHPFLWQGPSGRTLPVFNGWPYDKGWREGIGRSAEEFAGERWPRLQAYLNEIGYSLPILLLQSYHPYGDNGTAFDFTPFIEAWNGSGREPRIVMATPAMWWEAVRPHLGRLATLRGDWTDFWNFGCGSSAREQAINRRSRETLRNADALHAALTSMGGSGGWSERSMGRYRAAAYRNLHLWDEHTWGADASISDPEAEETATQWHHKAGYAYEARSLAQLLQRDALADFARLVERDRPDEILVFNPLPWVRLVHGPVSEFVVNPRGRPEDSTAGRHHQDREFGGRTTRPRGGWTLPPTAVDGFGYVVVPRETLIGSETPSEAEEGEIVDTERFRLTFDRERGGIVSLYDKLLEHEWVDQSAEYRLNRFVSERVADAASPWPRELMFRQEWKAPLAEIPSGWRPDWPAERLASGRVLSHQVTRGPLGTTVKQISEAPGTAGPLEQVVFLPSHGDYVECASRWTMGLSAHPEATYLVFPFDLANAEVRFDAGGQPVAPEADQLPGVCRDYFTVQNWVDFSNDRLAMTVTMPENPMVQLGGFRFGAYRSEFCLERPHLLGWVTNNYWETNFRAYQPGRVEARYRLYPHHGPFDEAAAHRAGRESAQPTPLVQHLGEAPVGGRLPRRGRLLALPADPVQTLHLSERDGSVEMRLLNASDSPVTATIGPALLRVAWAERCGVLGEALGSLEAAGGAVSCEIEPRRVAVLRLRLEPTPQV